jgi:hypothetical protein
MHAAKGDANCGPQTRAAKGDADNVVLTICRTKLMWSSAYAIMRGQSNDDVQACVMVHG